MGRQRRIQFPGALYHVMSHGNGFQWIYKDPLHLSIFKESLKKDAIKYKVIIHAVILMRNHYHMLIETLLGNLSDFMRKFNHDFAFLFNRMIKRTGAIFKQRYKSIIIDKENYYFNVMRYICQNPVRKGIVEKCEDYKGSFLNWLLDDDFKGCFHLEWIKDMYAK